MKPEVRSPKPGLHLHFDCASGIAGDMTLGALLDLGVPIDAVGDALDAIGVGRGRLQLSRVVRGGIAAADVRVDTTTNRIGFGLTPGDFSSRAGDFSSRAGDFSSRAGDFSARAEAGEASTVRGGAQPGHHGHHAHYRYSAIRERIAGATLAPGVAARALDIFDRIARAEAKLHGMSIADVAFHEVGAIDSVVDVVGTAAALAWLAPASASCASIAMGSGTLHCAHGVLPVPAPASLEILREAGGVMADGGIARELCTPTGAAIAAATVTRWAPAPTGRPVAVGWGAGDADLADRPNVVRVVLVEPVHPAHAVAGATADTVVQIDANVDDMSPELCAPALDAAFAAGALDAWWTPIAMKKGRPALLLSALATAATRDAVVAAILRETTTIGVRLSERQRVVLPRRIVTVDTPYGSIAVKVAGDPVVNVAPEYEACAAAAATHGVAVKVVFAAAIAGYFRA